ncbi:MAG: hypothetical protein II997_01750 [Clostridia bacterium]|nr:hypothetical protein [Clostridia bacterium]
MKHVKSLLALVLTLMLICGMAVVPAAAAVGTLVGDAKLFLPSTGAIKVQYTLTNEGSAVAGAVYHVVIYKDKDGNDSTQELKDETWKYAQIDAATGELYVSQAAKGMELRISATLTENDVVTVSGSRTVVVSDVSYGTNFDKMPPFITTSVAVAKDSDENSFAPFYGGKWGNTFTNYIDLTGVNFATSHLTMEAKFKSTGESNRNANADTGVVASYWNPTYPFQIVYDKSFVGCGAWNNAGDQTQIVTAEWSTATTSTAQTSQMNFTQYSYNENATTNNGYYRASNSKTGTYTYTGSYTTDANAATNGTFSDDFEFIDFKAEIIDDKAYTTLGDTKTEHNFVNHISNVSVADANIKTINFGAPIDDLEIYTGAKVSAEIFDAYKIEGLDKLYLPASGTGKTTYVMKDRNGATVSGATYSISGDNDLGTYALMDAATGELLINSAASGKTINVTAQIGEDTVTKTITTDRIYVDFENETIGSAVTNSAFSSKSATVVANGSGKAAAASSATGLAMSFADFDYPNYTMEANISTDQGGTLVTVNQAGASGSTRYFTEVPTGKPNERNLCFKGNVTDWSADTRGGSFAFTTGAYYPFTLKVTDYYKATASWNNIVLSNTYLWGHNASSTAAAYTDLSSIAFGTMVDDIQIYNVDKASGSYAISGQTDITRAPIGTSANFAYKAAASLPWATGEGLTWGISGSYTGVSVNEATGVVTVAGSAATGTFTLQLKEGGAVVAEKAVKIVDATDQWVDDKSRTFLDFENQSDYVGKAPAHRITGVSNYNDIPLSFERRGESSLTKEEDLVTGVIQQESNGNLYVTALGQAWWGANGSTFRFYPYGLKDRKWLEGAESATLEADFMIESDKMSTRLGERYSLLSENLATGATVATASDIEVSYRYFADGTAGIYTGYWTKDEEGGDITAATLVGVVNADEWFNVRLEFNFVNKTYDLYVNNQKLAVAEPIKKDHIECFYVGAAIDNIAAYHGAKAVDEVALTTSFKDGVAAINDAAFATAIAVNETEIKTISVTLGEAAPAGVSSDAKLIIAQYSGDKMVKMTSVPVTVVNGKLYGCAALTAEYAAGDTVKAFLWNWGTLQPVK